MNSDERTQRESLLKMPVFWLIIIAAAVIRIAACWSSLPYFSFADEGQLLHPVAQMLSIGSLDPGWYRLPSFTMYCIAIAVRVYALFATGNLDQELISNGSASYDIIEPAYLILCARIVVALFGVGVVCLTGLLASLCCNRHVGLAATAFACLLPALAIRSTYVGVNTPLTFLILLSMFLASEAIDDNGRSRLLLWSSFVAGLAFSTKYPGGIVFLCPLISFSRIEFKVPARWPIFLGLNGCLLGGILLGTPALLWNWNAVIADILSSNFGFWTQAGSTSYINQLLLPHEAGWPFVIVAIGGFIRLLKTSQARYHLQSWSLYLTIFIGGYFFFDYQAFGNMLPVIPLLCVAAAALFFGKNSSSREKLIISWLLVSGLSIALGLQSIPLLNTLRQQRDSRTDAMNYAASSIDSQQNVTVVQELAIQPSQLKTLRAPHTTRPRSELINKLQPSHDKFVIAGSQLTSELTSRGYCAKASYGHLATPKSTLVWRSNKLKVNIWAPCSK